MHPTSYFYKGKIIEGLLLFQLPFFAILSKFAIPLSSSASGSSSVRLGAKKQFIDFLAFSPQRVDGTETVDIKLLREVEWGNFGQLQKNAQEMVGTVTTKPTALIFVMLSDTLHEV